MNALNLKPIVPPEPITAPLHMPRIQARHLPPTTPAATPDDQLAREAVAMIEREDGFHACAEHRLRGSYDGDSEHRIALAAIRLARR